MWFYPKIYQQIFCLMVALKKFYLTLTFPSRKVEQRSPVRPRNLAQPYSTLYNLMTEPPGFRHPIDIPNRFHQLFQKNRCSASHGELAFILPRFKTRKSPISYHIFLKPHPSPASNRAWISTTASFYRRSLPLCKTSSLRYCPCNTLCARIPSHFFLLSHFACLLLKSQNIVSIFTSLPL